MADRDDYMAEFRKKNAHLKMIRFAKKGDKESVLSALHDGVDINAQDERGYTAAAWAAKNNHRSILAALKSRGADVNIQDYWGNTPLLHACAAENEKCVETLLEAGADVNLQNEEGSSALIEAAKSGKLEIVHSLLSQGANIDVTTKFENTALIWACLMGEQRTAETLMAYGADAGVSNADGTSAFSAAVDKGYLDIAYAVSRYCGVNSTTQNTVCNTHSEFNCGAQKYDRETFMRLHSPIYRKDSHYLPAVM